MTLASIVANGATRADRCRPGFRPLASGDPARLERWRERSARGDAAQFAKRLSWLGTTERDILPFLGDVECTALPEWATLFDDAAKFAGATPIANHPFADVLAPFVAAASARLDVRNVFPADVVATFAAELLRRLSYIAGPTLYLEFCVARSLHDGEGDPYAKFVRDFDRNHFFEQYPVLARLLGTAMRQWIRNLNELAQQLVDDRSDLDAIFEPLGDVVAVQPWMSDPHDDGRTVTAIAFASGVELIHKTRDLGIERAWFSLLAWLNERGGEFRLLRVLNRGTHGWSEAARPAPCADESDAKRYYARAGMLLAVMYALEASDCFYENIVACGAHPVLVDMETLMHHVLRRENPLAPADAADDLLFDSVFRAGFLPNWEAGLDGTSVDISGLCARSGQVTSFRKRVWKDVNTGAMTLSEEPIVVDSESHLPHLGARALDAAEYVDDFIDGFRFMYRRLVELRDELPLDDLGRQQIRLVVHATRIYSMLLKRLYAPRFMRDGLDRSFETEVLSRFYLDAPEKQRRRAVLEQEIEALERLDVPRFTLRADSRDLPLPDGSVIRDAFEASGIDRVRARLAKMSESDLDLQVEFIRAAIGMSSELAFPSEEPEEPEEPRGTQQDLRAAALAIADDIARRAIRRADGSLTWIAPQLPPRATHHELRPLRLDLYGGLAGVALFFAAVERVAPGRGRELALAALAPLRAYIAAHDGRAMLRDGYTLGAGNGIGSFAYALARCAALLDSDALLEDARRAATHLADELLDADEILDVMSGAAGAIHALLVIGDEASVTRAFRAGLRLLATRETAGTGAAWGAQGRFLAGFSHGAAGIALALDRLAHATGEARFAHAAADAIAYETSIFDEAEGNWPDLRRGRDERAFMNAWCHGAAGIGMARVAGGGPATDVDAAVRLTLRSAPQAKDGLCCGNLGRAELLLLAGRHDDARRTASDVTARAAAKGYRISGRNGTDFFDPSFFQGLSGIGYELLRVAEPDLLPSVLTFA